MTKVRHILRPRSGVDRALPLVLGIVTFATRWATHGRFPTEYDSVQLVLGVGRFDVADATPHAPGYWLYVAAGRALDAVTGLGAHRSLVLLAALASAATVALTYVLGRDLAGRRLGLLAAAFLFSSPFLWFYGSMPATYDFDALTSVALMLIAWRARPGSRNGLAAALVLGVGAGFRPTSLIVLAPLALVAALRSVRSVPQALGVVAAGAVALAVWVVPMSFDQPGGLAVIRRENAEQWASVARRTSIVYGAPRDGVLDNAGQVAGYTAAGLHLLVPLGIAAFVVGLFGRRVRQMRETPRLRLTPGVLLWIACLPPLAFVLGFHFGKAGYVLSYLPGFVLLLLLPVARLDGRWRTVFTVAALALCVLNAQRFLAGEGVVPGPLMGRGLPLTEPARGAPYNVTASVIRRTDRETADYLELRDVFDPRCDDLVYLWLDGSQRFRHATMTLPEFTIDLVHEGFHEFRAHRLRRHEEYDGDLTVPHGGRAVLVLDGPTPEVTALVQAGEARVLALPRSGRVVWLVRPGRRLFGIDLEEAPAAPGAPACR